MGFAWDTPITEDADLEQPEQGITRLLQGSNTYANIHKDAANAIIRDLVGMGYDPATLETKYFEREAKLWIYVEIFSAQARDGNTRAQAKAQFYLEQLQREQKGRVYKSTTETRSERTLPMVGNLDHGYFNHSGLRRQDGGKQVGRRLIESFDDHVKDNPN